MFRTQFYARLVRPPPFLQFPSKLLNHIFQAHGYPVNLDFDHLTEVLLALLKSLLKVDLSMLIFKQNRHSQTEL